MTDSEEMPCNELVEVITEYLEGTLPAPDAIRFEAHLEVCPYCRSYLEQMRQTIAVLGKLSDDAIPEGDRDNLVSLFRGWKRAAES